MKEERIIDLKAEQLINLLDARLVKRLEELKDGFLHEKANDQLLSRQATAELLGINLSTLWAWTRDGKLNVYGIANRRYYKRIEVINALVQLKK